MDKNFFSEIVRKFKLTLRLVKDQRVSPWLKLIPVFCLIYLIVPIDLLIGPIDDAVVIYFGMDLFIDLCPAEIVREHMRDLGVDKGTDQGEDVIDAEFKEIK